LPRGGDSGRTRAVASNGSSNGLNGAASVTNVVVAGATGLVGREVMKVLAGRPKTRAFALVRELRGGLPDDAHEVRFDYEAKASYDNLGEGIPCDVLLCCLGTTRAKAGSDEAFRRVDRDYPIKLLERLTKLPGKPVYGLVSSIGAGKPRGLYLITKAEVERAVIESGLPYAIVRPSILVGDRAEHRPGERAATAVMAPLSRLARAILPHGPVDRYAPIGAGKVAAALVHYALDAGPRPTLIVEGTGLVDPG
jgi:uncharacterized protein YbjT (DUF2867 family)